MVTALSIAWSGMNAAQRGLQASAHNIANLSTEGFRREQMVRTEAANGAGVDASLTRATEPGGAIEADLVGLLQDRNAFLANLAVFRASERAHGELLDISA